MERNEDVHGLARGRWASEVEARSAAYQAAGADRKKSEQAKEAAEQVLADTETVRDLLQSVAVTVQDQVHKQIAAVVSRCLTTVFGADAYGFKIRFEKKRGRTEAVLLFVHEDEEYDDPTGESSGGQVEVAAFGLRLACLLMLRPKKRRILVLDEPFKNVNGEVYQDRFVELLTALSEEMDLQIVMANDKPWLKIGKVIEV